MAVARDANDILQLVNIQEQCKRFSHNYLDHCMAQSQQPAFTRMSITMRWHISSMRSQAVFICKWLIACEDSVWLQNTVRSEVHMQYVATAELDTWMLLQFWSLHLSTEMNPIAEHHSEV